MFYGYVRVSTRDQNEDRQIIALLEAGVPEKNIILDKKSGKNFDRPGYRELCRRMKAGDTLLSKASIDWAAITVRSWTSGAVSRKKNAYLL